jgi:hypothetical protein
LGILSSVHNGTEVVKHEPLLSGRGIYVKLRSDLSLDLSLLTVSGGKNQTKYGTTYATKASTNPLCGLIPGFLIDDYLIRHAVVTGLISTCKACCQSCLGNLKEKFNSNFILFLEMNTGSLPYYDCALN